MLKKIKPVVLVIMDGWGLAPKNFGNAVALAKTPNLQKLMRTYPHTELVASGSLVGLPEEQDGNSEAGHMNLGAGRIVEQDAVKINHAISNGTFFKNAAFLEAINYIKRHASSLHLMGLLTNGMSAHSYPDHLYALMALAAEHNIKRVYLHLFTDGRDSGQHEAMLFLKTLRQNFKHGEIIASIQGRYYAMERNKRWEITKLAYELLTEGKGRKVKSAEEAITTAYNSQESDEFIKPCIINPEGIVREHDALIFFNLRSDRARQLAKAFVQPEFERKNPGAFKRKVVFKHLRFIAMTDFGPDLDSILSAFPSEDLKNTLPMLLHNLRQLYLAESEKYAHVTYFLNGGYADPVNGEARLKIASPDCKSYDLKPEMSAHKITAYLLRALKAQRYDFYCVNYANPDMVGHTGNLSAGIKACTCIDQQIGLLYQEIKKQNGTLIITADHGNVEEMINLETGEVDTEHSKNPVPFIITQKGLKLKKNKPLCLGRVAPSILKLFDLPKNLEMLEPLW